MGVVILYSIEINLRKLRFITIVERNLSLRNRIHVMDGCSLFSDDVAPLLF